MRSISATGRNFSINFFMAVSKLFVGGSILITLAVVLDVLFCYIVGNVIKNNETLD